MGRCGGSLRIGACSGGGIYLFVLKCHGVKELLSWGRIEDKNLFVACGFGFILCFRPSLLFTFLPQVSRL